MNLKCWPVLLSWVVFLCACAPSGGLDPDALSSSSSNPSSSSSGKIARDFTRARTMNLLLGQGINLGNYLEAASSEGAWTGGVKIEQSDMTVIKNAGFQSVRIPVRWNRHLDNTNTIIPSFMTRVREVIRWANDAGLLAIVNIHHFDELFKPQDYSTTLEQQLNIFVSIWTQVEQGLADFSNDSLIFEVINEPQGAVTSTIHNQMVATILPVMRVHNPLRTLMVGMTGYGQWSGVKRLQIPETENNIILSVHYYSPINFTHYLTSPQYSQKLEWETAGEYREMNEDFAHMNDSLQVLFPSTDGLGIPLNIGEFGVTDDADMASRVRWTTNAVANMRKYNMSYHFWKFSFNFGAYDKDREQWYPELLNALIATAPLN